MKEFEQTAAVSAYQAFDPSTAPAYACVANAGTQLLAEIRIEDPIYLEAPVHLQRTGRRARDLEILPFDCVPEVAGRANERSRED
jgi:hypothetical protein